MAIDFRNVNISIAKFQAQSKGVYNAGEVKLTGSSSIGIVNNHVGKLRCFNTTRHTHGEVLAVKQAFVDALVREGGLNREQINDVRRDLGLAPCGEGGDADMLKRSIKPLSRQQVREILDKYADEINGKAKDGRPVVVKSQDLYGRVEAKVQAERVSRREEINQSLDRTRTVVANDDVNLFERLVAGSIYDLDDEERQMMLEMAKSSLGEVRGRMEAHGNAGQAQGTMNIAFKDGKSITFATGLDDGYLAARLEDDIFNLANPVWKQSGGVGTAEIDAAAHNKGVVNALTTARYMNGGEALPLPHEFNVMADALLAEARSLFGHAVVPDDAAIGDFTDSVALRAELLNLGNDAKLGPDGVRDLVRESVKGVCVAKKINEMLEHAGEIIFIKTDVYPRAFMERHPEVVTALSRAKSFAEVKSILDANGELFRDAVKIMAEANRFVPNIKIMTAERLAAKTGISFDCAFAMMKDAALPFSGQGIAMDIVSGKIDAKTPASIERAFRDRIAAYVDAKAAALGSIDSYGLGPRASHKLKARILSMEYIDARVYDIEKFHTIALALKDSLGALAVAFGAENLDAKAAFNAFDGLIAAIQAELKRQFGHEFQIEDLSPAAHAIFAMCVPEDSDLPEKVVAFFARPDLKAEMAGNDWESITKVSFARIANEMCHDGKNLNAGLVSSIGNYLMPPYHAQAMLDALSESGFEGVNLKIATEAFRDAAAVKSLATKIKASNTYVLPGAFKDMVKATVAELGRKFADRLTKMIAAYAETEGRQADLAKFIDGGGDAAQYFRDVLDRKMAAVKTGLHNRIVADIRKATVAQFTCGVSLDMKDAASGKDPQIKKDFKRQSVLVNGKLASRDDFGEFRNSFARLVIRDDTAIYAALDAKSKRKVDILMAFMSQSAKNAILTSVNYEFSSTGRTSAFLSVKQAEWDVAINISGNGDVEISMNGLDANPKVVMAEDGSMHSCKDGSEIRYGFKMSLKAAEIERLAGLDYSGFSKDEYAAHIAPDSKAEHPFQTALDKIAPQFRINADVEVGFHATLK
jgi:hypothetical protein